MKRVLCYVAPYQDYGIFVGVLLSQQNDNNLNKVRESTEFYNLLSEKLEHFLSIYSYSRENCEKYFSR